ncbi:MAG TPA: S41 family peptidase [Tissierellales bacterium]|nr:S41 family peptidase [Tissierellales bacterium]
MKNKKILIILIIAIVLILVAFIYNNTNKLKELTTEEKLEDFRYMYNIFEENYPHFYEVRKLHGIDWLKYKEHFEDRIIKTESNMEFFNELNYTLSFLDDSHADVISPAFYYSYYSMFYDYRENKEDNDNIYKKLKPWIDIWLSAEKKYRDWYEVFKEEFPDEYKIELEEFSKSIDIDNVITKIIEDEKIAYLKIKSFSIDSTEEIINFLKSVKDYPYLIIDIMDNVGGNDFYWNEMFLSLLNEDKKIENHYLVRGGEYLNQFLESELFSGFTKEDIDKCPYYDKLPKEIKKDFKYYISMEHQLLSEHSIGFDGEVFLLVNEKNFSSADKLINNCKKADVATVVGYTTNGGGIGVNPIFISLPNSGLIVRFEGEMGFNEDGTSNFMGTKPDIEIEKIGGKNYNQKVIQETINIIHSIEEEKR